MIQVCSLSLRTRAGEVKTSLNGLSSHRLKSHWYAASKSSYRCSGPVDGLPVVAEPGASASEAAGLESGAPAKRWENANPAPSPGEGVVSARGEAPMVEPQEPGYLDDPLELKVDGPGMDLEPVEIVMVSYEGEVGLSAHTRRGGILITTRDTTRMVYQTIARVMSVEPEDIILSVYGMEILPTSRVYYASHMAAPIRVARRLRLHGGSQQESACDASLQAAAPQLRTYSQAVEERKTALGPLCRKFVIAISGSGKTHTLNKIPSLGVDGDSFESVRYFFKHWNDYVQPPKEFARLLLSLKTDAVVWVHAPLETAVELSKTASVVIWHQPLEVLEKHWTSSSKHNDEAAKARCRKDHAEYVASMGFHDLVHTDDPITAHDMVLEMARIASQPSAPPLNAPVGPTLQHDGFQLLPSVDDADSKYSDESSDDEPPPLMGPDNVIVPDSQVPQTPPQKSEPTPDRKALSPQEEASLIGAMNKRAADHTTALRLVALLNRTQKRPARMKLIKRIMRLINDDSGYVLVQRGTHYHLGYGNRPQGAVVKTWEGPQPLPPPSADALYVEIKAKQIAPLKVKTVRRRAKARPAPAPDLALFDHADAEWEQHLVLPPRRGPVYGPPNNPHRGLPQYGPEVAQSETTVLRPEQKHDSEWYFSVVGGVGLRFHKPTVDAIADVVAGCYERKYASIQQRDLDMSRMAKARVKSVFDFVKRPREEHGYNLDLDADRQYEIGGINEAKALYAAEAVMCAQRSWALQLRGTQPSRDFVPHDRVGAYRDDAQRDYKSYCKNYGTPLPLCTRFRVGCHNAWEHVKHPMAVNKRNLLPTVELPRAIRRIQNSRIYQPEKGLSHPADDIIPDMMFNVNTAVRFGVPVNPTYRNFW